jgi:predicted acylesterase/phospholipase RssA
MYSGLVNSAASAAAQRKLADVLLRPPLANVDLLNWQAFDRAIEAGYLYACRTLEELTDLPRCAPTRITGHGISSLEAELERRAAATAAADVPAAKVAAERPDCPPSPIPPDCTAPSSTG